MKGKKPAFSNTSTGYGKSKAHHNTHNHNSSHKQAKIAKVEKNKDQDEQNKAVPDVPDTDQDLNSGFGDYIRSPEAVEMMKLFVFANSIMLILTMAWPTMKENYYMFMHWWWSVNQ